MLERVRVMIEYEKCSHIEYEGYYNYFEDEEDLEKCCDCDGPDCINCENVARIKGYEIIGGERYDNKRH